MKKKQCMFDFENKNFFDTKNNFEKDEAILSILLYGNRKKDCQVSIMIPTYLRNDYLVETIDSVLAQKTNILYEVVVVDNNDDYSDSTTLSLLKKYDPQQICYYKNERNLGMFGNWNRCIKLAHAEWVLILHDDDTIEENYIDEMMKIVVKCPDLICVGCEHKEIDINGNEIVHNNSLLQRLYKKMSAEKKLEILMKDMYYSHPIDIMGCFFRRESAIFIGGFDEEWYPISDYIFLLNMVAHGKVCQMAKLLLRYRIGVNISYRIDHVIGCVEADVSMRKCINERYRFETRRKDTEFRSWLEKTKEMNILNRFGKNLSSAEKQVVDLEFQRYKSYCGLKELSNIRLSVFSWLSRWYLFKMHCIRARNCR